MPLLALAVAAQLSGVQLAPAPQKLWDVAWTRRLVEPSMLEWKAREVGGPAVDPTTGTVVVGTRDGFLRAYTAAGELLWQLETHGRFDGAPRVDGELVFAGCSDGRLYAVELASGQVRWKYDAQEELGTTPAVAGGLVLAMTLQDTLVAVDAKTGAWKWHHRRESREGFTIRGAASVTVAGDVVLGAYSDGTVAALDLLHGTARWERRVVTALQFSDVDSTPRVQGGRVYVASYAGFVLALDLATGKQLWTFGTPAPLRLAVSRGIVVAVTTTQIVGLSAADGVVRWTLPLGGSPGGEPAVIGGRAAVPNGKGLVWIDVERGRVLRVFDPGTGVSASPAVSGGRVYVLSNGGDLVALDLA